jgi:Ca2+-binding RTX toxin-like protein
MSRAVLATVCTIVFVAVLAGGAPATAAPPNPHDDGAGKEWRALYQTTGLTWTQVAAICPQDGVTPCSGSIGTRDFNRWVWATPEQVIELMGRFEPAILTANPSSVSGEAYFGSAQAFLTSAQRWTGYISTYTSYTEWAAGWTSATDDAGLPIEGRVGWGFWPPGGGFLVEGRANHPDTTRGIWLWRPSGIDYTAPVITPTVGGTLGSNGWYVSDVSVSWDVQDSESEVSSRAGCDAVTVSSDTAGTTIPCEATSEGGTATRSVFVQRDTTPPNVICPSPAPVFQLYQLGAWVTAAVEDATSGRANAPAQGITNTSTPGTFTTPVTGADRAGNRATTQCSYQVVIPTCNGLEPTRVGTSGNDVITGTSGRDVIVGMSGADTIKGLGGDDVICGGDGPELVYGGDGQDWIAGGASPDDLNGDNGDDFLDGGLHNDSLRGGDGKDTCRSGEVRMSSCEL